MDTSSLLVFAAAYLAVLILPGPGVTSLVARVLAHGTAGLPAFIGGFVAGALIWFTVAATGLALLASHFATVFLVIRYLGAAYLLYMAWKLWTRAASPTAVAEAPRDRQRLFFTGLAINLGNPKAIAFFLALLPSVVDLGSLTPLGFAQLFGIVLVIATGVLSAYALAAARARRLFRSARAMQLANRGSSLVMAGSALSIAAR